VASDRSCRTWNTSVVQQVRHENRPATERTGLPAGLLIHDPRQHGAAGFPRGSARLAALLTGTSFAIRSFGLQHGSDQFEEKYTHRLFTGLFSQRLSYFAGQSLGAITEKLSLRFVLKDALVKSILPSVLSVLSLLLMLTYLILVSPPLASLLVVGSTAWGCSTTTPPTTRRCCSPPPPAPCSKANSA